MKDTRKTTVYDRHVSLGAEMTEFCGWSMPMFYPSGIVEEHLATRKRSGVFDISHMGRFRIQGADAKKFLQHVLTNNVDALNIRDIGAQYTLIANDSGGVIDDAYLYCFAEDAYLLVVNACNRQKDWDHLTSLKPYFDDVTLEDITGELAMFALQGPCSREILETCLQSGNLPNPIRNAVSLARMVDRAVMVARTGYTGEPQCFELFVQKDRAAALWDAMISAGAVPVGLGARDTLRLEAGLPLYGHELGEDPDGKGIPAMACPQAKFAVSFSRLKGEFIGRDSLVKQLSALSAIMARDYSLMPDLPRMIKPVALKGRGVARQGAKVYKNKKFVGYITSGTMVPMWVMEGEGLGTVLTDTHKLRSICLAYVDSDIVDNDPVEIEIRKKMVAAQVVPYHLRADAPPYARPIVVDQETAVMEPSESDTPEKVGRLLSKTLENTKWRQTGCINLIPSEMSISPMVRMLSIMDPACRYAEHRKSKAFYDADIFYYQGTDFIREVERLLVCEMQRYLGCPEVETRLISGQMANAAVFSAMMDYINRTDRKQEPRRMRQVMNNHIGRGGHLSAQPMGALRDFVARDPRTERPAVVNFPVCGDNPYKIDVPGTLALIDDVKPELIIFGKSMVLHKEPVSRIRKFIDAQKINATVMYDMAHVLGLVGPHFQQPFAEGADIVTGSTHKTFFGTQRGVVGCRFSEDEEKYALWEALVRRTFPGSVSNHHLGTLLGLLMAAYEMNHFKEEYQPKVLANAKVFARALKDCGLSVCGDPAIGFTETHQVIVHVGYAKGADVATELERNNIICNYQATPDEEGFTVAGGLRFGVSEMTRFGMDAAGFQELAGYIHEVIVGHKDVKQKVAAFRKRFLEMKYCFSKDDVEEVVEKLHDLMS